MFHACLGLEIVPQGSENEMFHACLGLVIGNNFNAAVVGPTNSEDANADTSQAVAVVGGIPQGPTFIQAGRSYADAVQDNRSTHSIELIK